MFEADALENGVDAVVVGELAHALDRLVSSLADDVRRPELARERDPVRVPAEEDDLLGAEALRGDHAAEADSAVSDDSDGLSRAHFGGDGRMMARAHHVRQREERRHERVVLADRQDEERPIGLRDADGFRLSACHLDRAEETAVGA